MSPDELLEWSFSFVQRFGVPLAVLAWVTVFAASVAMFVVLRSVQLRDVALRAGVVGGLALTAHLLDFFVTLDITPDLSMEANPLWRVIIDGFGLRIAKAYGFSGKVLLSVLSFQLFAWHLAHRSSLFPPSAASFGDFVQRLGVGAPRFGNVRSFFAFAFALFGPYFFYITLMNVTGDRAPALYGRLPSPPVAIAIFFVGIIAAYFVTMWRAFRKSGR
jgi:hypothetical protein